MKYKTKNLLFSNKPQQFIITMPFVVHEFVELSQRLI